MPSIGTFATGISTRSLFTKLYPAETTALLPVSIQRVGLTGKLAYLFWGHFVWTND